MGKWIIALLMIRFVTSLVTAKGKKLRLSGFCSFTKSFKQIMNQTGTLNSRNKHKKKWFETATVC